MPPLGRYGESIADLILRQGDVQARNAMMSGQIWSNAIQNIGQAGAQAYEGYREEKRQKQISDEFTRLVSNPQTWQDNPQATMSRLVPLVGAKGATELMRAISGIAETQMKAQKYQMDARTAAREDLPNLAALQHNTPMGARDEALTSFLTQGLEAAGYPTDNPYETLEGIYRGGQEPRMVKTVDAQGNPVERLVGPEELAQGVPVYQEEKRYRVTVPGPNGPVEKVMPESALEEGVPGYERPRQEPSTTLSPTAESNIINRLTTQWTKANQADRELQRQVGLMEKGLEAARRGDLAAGSQAVLVTFQKILDPTSVVRESEYARSASGLSLLSRIEGAAQTLQQGGAGVPVADLEKFARLARDMASGQSDYVSAVRKRLLATAKRYNIPPELVVEEYGGQAEPAPKPWERKWGEE